MAPTGGQDSQRNKLNQASTLALLWGARDRPSRGPRPGLTVDAIVRAAIAIADADGLDAVSMQRVAADLGYTTMSLYRYVSSKDQLLVIMLDTVVGTPPAMEDVTGWREHIQRWIHAMWELYARHPWTLQVPISGPPTGPNNLAWFESALSAFTAAGLSAGEMISAATFLNSAVRELARVSVDIARAREQAGVTSAEAEQSYGRILARYAGTDRYPTLAGLVASGVFQPPEEGGGDIDVDLEFGLQRVLDGIQTLVDAREGGTTSAPNT